MITCFNSSHQTAQVAHQQGKYLGRKLNSLVWVASPNKAEDRVVYSAASENDFERFSYKHLGSLAYIGMHGTSLLFYPTV